MVTFADTHFNSLTPRNGLAHASAGRKLLLFLCASLIPFFTSATSAQTVPKRMAVYYGYPSSVNGAAGDLASAVDSFSDYEIVLLGDGLQFPQATGAEGENPSWGCDQTHHWDHDNTELIISELVAAGKQVFGYTTAGGAYTAYKHATPPCAPTTDEIKTRINMWETMGVTGIFLDEAEWGFGSSRVRQSSLIDYVRGKGLKVMINGYFPDHIFSSDPVPDHISSPDPVWEQYSETVPTGSFQLIPGTTNDYSVHHPLLVWPSETDSLSNITTMLPTMVCTT